MHSTYKILLATLAFATVVELGAPLTARAQQPAQATDTTHLDSATVAALRAGARPISLDDAVRLAE